MPQYGPPLCLQGCIYFKDGPKFIGDSGKCVKYILIPKIIFYQGGSCQHYTKEKKTNQ